MSDPPSRQSRNDENARERPARSLSEWLRSVLGLRGEATFRESLEELIEEHEESAEPLDADESTLFRNLLSFGDLEVEDVMVPRIDIVAVPADIALDAIVRVMIEAGHSRLPVYRDTTDNVIGMVHVRDLLRYWGGDGPFSLSQVLRRLLFVPPSMPIHALLLQMRKTKVHMAIVVDEHGGTDGLVTIEDLVEEIVGEIEDEHDRTAGPMLVELSDGCIDANARVPLPELEQRLGLELLPDDDNSDIDTLGGLVIDLASRVPQRGEMINHPGGVTFEILDADPRRVRRLRVHRPAGADAARRAASR